MKYWDYILRIARFIRNSKMVPYTKCKDNPFKSFFQENLFSLKKYAENVKKWTRKLWVDRVVGWFDFLISCESWNSFSSGFSSSLHMKMKKNYRSCLISVLLKINSLVWNSYFGTFRDTFFVIVIALKILVPNRFTESSYNQPELKSKICQIQNDFAIESLSNQFCNNFKVNWK